MTRPIAARVGATVLVATMLTACATTTAGKGTHGPIPRPTPSPSESSRGLPTASTAPPSSPPSSPSSAPVTVPITSSAPSTAPVTSGSAAPADIQRVLLTPDDISAGFTATPDNSVTTAAEPCTPNDPPVDVQVPAVEHGGVDLANKSKSAEVDEQVALYDTTAHAIKLQTATEKGFACTSGQLGGGQTVTISGPQDLASIITPHVDKAEGWTIKTSDLKGSLVMVRLNRVIVQFAFLAKKGTSPKINGKQILETALAKVINGG